MSGTEPVRRQLLVEASQATAFRVFTEGIDSWWPREHHIGTSPLKREVIEPRLGGRWYSICQDDSECNVGRVLAWEPPRRLVLAWQITADWKYDPTFVTEVEVNFIAAGPKKTRMEFEHRNLHKYGVAAETVRKALDAPGGWRGTLESYAKAVAADSQ